MPKLITRKSVNESAGVLGNAIAKLVAEEERVKKLTPSERIRYKASKYPVYKNVEIPFIQSKKIKLTNAGLATGAQLSTNLLDSIAKYAELEGLPIKTAIGLATKESTLGNPTIDKSLNRLGFNIPFVNQNINNGKTITGHSLINYHNDDNPYIDLLSTVSRKKPKNIAELDSMLLAGERYADNQAKKHRKEKVNILQAGLRHYKNNPNKYNPGQSNYQQLVNKRANEVWNSPEIQNWYNTYMSARKIAKNFLKSMGYYKNGGTIHTIRRKPPIHTIRKLYENGGDVKKDPYAPIKGYKTKGYDTETTQWLFDWLNNRRKILLDNYNNYGYALSKYTAKEGKDIRDTKFEREKVNAMYNPIDYLRGYDPNRTKLNKILYTEIENAGSAPEINVPDNYGNMPIEPSYGTLGLYTEPNNWDGTGHYIAYLGYPSKTTKIHERTHAMNASPQHDAISKIITKSEDEYLDNPKEIYARLMQYRYNNELKPTDIIDKNYLNKNREKLKKLELDRYKDEELIRLFNEVAQNDMNKNNLDAIRFYGKNGGTIHINPANRGKFNATKRRTGKTTEELTHSKNPKTRKRAIFAQNAAKWRKRG